MNRNDINALFDLTTQIIEAVDKADNNELVDNKLLVNNLKRELEPILQCILKVLDSIILENTSNFFSK